MKEGKNAKKFYPVNNIWREVGRGIEKKLNHLFGLKISPHIICNISLLINKCLPILGLILVKFR